MNAHASQNGAALIVVLWSVAIMGTLTMIFTSQSRLTLQVSNNIENGLEAEMLAEAGLYRAIGELVTDRDLFGSDSLSEPWNNSSSMFLDVGMGTGTYRLSHPNLQEPGSEQYGAMDESGKLNINIATREQLLQLPGMTPEIADALIDWRDENETPEPFGAEAEYYAQLEEPYLPKNANFDSVEELLLVRDITVELLYGEDINTNGLLDINENDGAETFPGDNMDDQLNMGWYPFITCYSHSPNTDQNGIERTNINSADEEMLQDMLGDYLDEEAIARIVQARDDEEFESLPDLLSREVSLDDDDNNNGGGGGGRGGGNNNNNASENVLSREELRQVIDLITVSDESDLVGRVNLNTAPETVLNCLLPEQEDLVARILDYRDSDEGPFDERGEFFEIDEISDQALGTLITQAETKSNVFSIRARGTLVNDNAIKILHAIVDRRPDPPKIRSWKKIR